MAVLSGNLMAVLGIQVYGDVGPFTVYSRKDGQLVWYKRSPPDKPPSIRQLHQRGRFKLAMLDWKALSKEDRDIWESISLRTSVPWTGLNLHMMMTLRADMRNEIESYAREADYPGVPPWNPR